MLAPHGYYKGKYAYNNCTILDSRRTGQMACFAAWKSALHLSGPSPRHRYKLWWVTSVIVADADSPNRAGRKVVPRLKHFYWKGFTYKENSPGTFALSAAGRLSRNAADNNSPYRILKCLPHLARLQKLRGHDSAGSFVFRFFRVLLPG
jgi:hypothetical protein